MKAIILEVVAPATIAELIFCAIFVACMGGLAVGFGG